MSKVSLKKLTSKGATFLLGQSLLMVSANPQLAAAAETIKPEPVYEVGELFELSIQLSYLLLLLGLLGVGTFYVIRQVLVRRELDLSAKELQVLNPKHELGMFISWIDFGNLMNLDLVNIIRLTSSSHSCSTNG